MDLPQTKLRSAHVKRYSNTIWSADFRTTAVSYACAIMQSADWLLIMPAGWAIALHNLYNQMVFLSVILKGLGHQTDWGLVGKMDRSRPKKGLGHQTDWGLVGKMDTVDLGLQKGRGWFLNFLGASSIIHWNSHISCGKCDCELAYKVSCLFVSIPANHRPSLLSNDKSGLAYCWCLTERVGALPANPPSQWETRAGGWQNLSNPADQ